jgi:hypothetical protein
MSGTSMSDGLRPVLERLRDQLGLKIPNSGIEPRGEGLQAFVGSHTQLRNGTPPMVVFVPDKGDTAGPERVGESPRSFATYTIKFDCHCLVSNDAGLDGLWTLVENVYTACRDVFTAHAVPGSIEFFPPEVGLQGPLAIFQVSLDIDLTETVWDRIPVVLATVTTVNVNQVPSLPPQSRIGGDLSLPPTSSDQ